MINEFLHWNNASAQLPDDELTVLVYHPTLNEPVWLGYFSQGSWYTPDGMQLPQNSVTHWAEIPEGPGT